MATLDWQLTPAGDATLVELIVTSDADTRVEIESSLQPVWPPRRENRPAAGWDGSGFEGTVAAGEPLVLGYASPDDPVEPPAAIVETEPVPDDSGEPPTADDLVRALGDARPPRDAVPMPDDPQPGDAHPTAGSASVDRSPDRGPPVDDPSPRDRSPDVDTPPAHDGTPQDGHTSAPAESQSHNDPPDDHGSAPSGRSPGEQSPADRAPLDRERASNGQPPAEPGESVDTWLEAVGRRVETAQRLAAVETAEEARAAVRAAGGIDRVRALCERLDADRARMERTETRRAALDRQLADVDVPLSALERLA